MEQEMGIKTMPFTDIHANSADASLMHFCAFGLLKSALSKCRPTTLYELWIAIQEEWNKVPLSTVQKALLL